MTREVKKEVEDKRNKRRPPRPYPTPQPWRPEDNEERKHMKEVAEQTKKRITGKKNETQQIRLIINIIAPDTFDKKFGELR